VLWVVVLLEDKEGVLPILEVVVDRNHCVLEDFDIQLRIKCPINANEFGDAQRMDGAPDIDLNFLLAMGLRWLNTTWGESILSMSPSYVMAPIRNSEHNFGLVRVDEDTSEKGVLHGPVLVALVHAFTLLDVPWKQIWLLTLGETM
jgi:hypothetical protein